MCSHEVHVDMRNSIHSTVRQEEALVWETAENYDHSKTWEYIEVVRKHVIYPLETSGVADSCFAAALLVFGAIDGLGKLTHPNDNAGAGERFKSFLPRMGAAYVECKDELWNLRNSLAHNTMNVACFMSKTDDARGEHLERDHGFIFIHTPELLKHFKSAIEKLEAELRDDTALFQRANSRLERDYIDQPAWRGSHEVMSTPPPGVFFVRER